MAQIYKLLNKRFPQNFILKKPYIGTLIFLIFSFGFTIIYKPLNTRESQFFSYTVTIAIYCSFFSLTLFGLVKILKRIEYFSDLKEWTFFKELLSIVLILFLMGTTVYFVGFFLEEPSDRWNLHTFFNSCIITFLIGIIPFGFFFLINYRHLFVDEIIEQIETDNNPVLSSGSSEKIIQIGSRLKKEELSFYPSQFIYAESDGNYVVFYLKDEQKTRKVVIRNSINEIEQQLSTIPFFTRTHRAFIVNIKKVYSKKGNTLGYRLRLSDTENEIPVSRQNIQVFNQVLKQYNHPFITKNYYS
jgi:hypothetical protein